ncbi:CinA family nicotinamide mononucleotide deamidase-related protein [Motilimonas sp. E26]|uniref:CinA family nicotinamide mononucleotide deamidase-related protein n=1 Tax=Motilimonas sp. E26 TaxID=2865674 RepID=UPI001E2C1AC8|nr:CinA family nicotinamide mononucleotide deamidase-related protein [Motilimonas sp. E26]MCE0555441.1 CinA family nicotinamide mononucleotide deamidase-related protein [Motilimonas sp. E26]
MKIEIISTGDELITGQILDTNANWLCQQLFSQGLQPQRLHTVADNLNDLVALFIETSQRSDVVLVNGGLGPTSDDLSAQAAALAMQVPLVLNHSWLKTMEQKFAERGRVMAKANIKQAMLPQSSEVIDNANGTACGFSFTFNQARFYFTPGVPHEFKLMFSSQIWPDIATRFALNNKLMQYKITTFGLGESAIDDLIQDIVIPEQLHLGYRTASPEIEVKLISSDANAIKQVAQQIELKLADYVVFTSDESDTSAEKIQHLMLAKQATLALAESCTGGMIASNLVAIAGSSAYLDRAMVTYSNQAKQDLVQVSAETLSNHGAVSEATAIEMAKGAQRSANSDYALSVTGIAGPGGGSEFKPVGTVAFALATPTETYSQMLVLPGKSRTMTRKIASAIALDMLRRHLQDLPVCGHYDFAPKWQAN